MNGMDREMFEKRLFSIAAKLEYPPTPDVAGGVMRRLRGDMRPRARFRRLAWSLAALVILFTTLMAIPPARAAILEFIQIGVVRIFRTEQVEPTPMATATENASAVFPVTATPASSSAPLIPLLEELAGEMTLEQARASLVYPLQLPSYPPGLGEPDRVFVQPADGRMTILVWLDPGHPDRVLMSLHFVTAGSWAIDKMAPTLIEETEVNGAHAIWTTGPYPLRIRNGDIEFHRMIDGHVLIWTVGDITYRLETGAGLEEAIRIAESLEPPP